MSIHTPPASPVPVPVTGVANPAALDLIAHDPVTNEVRLVMTETRPWDGSETRLFELQEKINSYVSFALDGEMVEAFPSFGGQAIRLQLECTTYPDDCTIDFLDKIRRDLMRAHLQFDVRVLEKIPPASSPPSCACGAAPTCES